MQILEWYIHKCASRTSKPDVGQRNSRNVKDERLKFNFQKIKRETIHQQAICVWVKLGLESPNSILFIVKFLLLRLFCKHVCILRYLSLPFVSITNWMLFHNTQWNATSLCIIIWRCCILLQGKVIPFVLTIVISSEWNILWEMIMKRNIRWRQTPPINCVPICLSICSFHILLFEMEEIKSEY